MAGKAKAYLARLKLPEGKYDLSRHLKNFETHSQVRARDRQKRQCVSKWRKARSSPAHYENLVQRMLGGFTLQRARRLHLELRSANPDSFASSRFMRLFRRRFCGAVWRAVDGSGAAYLYTLVPRSGRFKAEELSNFDPRQLYGRLRTQCNRAGLAKANGWLISFLHGEYDPRDDCIQIHFHLVVVGDKTGVIERLRKHPDYKPSGHVKTPILRQVLRDPAEQLSYFLAQAFWPSRPSFQKNGKWQRASRRQRIPFPREAEVLMWIHQRTFGDLYWLHNVVFTGGQLVPRHPKKRSRGSSLK